MLLAGIEVTLGMDASQMIREQCRYGVAFHAETIKNVDTEALDI